MNEYYNYPKNQNNIKNDIKNPFSLTNLIRLNNHLYFKKVLKSFEKENSQKKNLNNIKRNNSISKDDIKRHINFNNTETKLNKDYSNYLINDNSNIFSNRLNKNLTNYTFKKNKLNNSLSTIFLYNAKYDMSNQSKLSDYILKPYKKKAIIINPKPNNKYKINKIKLDFSIPEINNKGNAYTDRIFNKTKLNNKNSVDKINIINLKNSMKDIKLNKKVYAKKEKIETNKALISVLDKEVYDYNNTSQKYEEKKKVLGKINSRENRAFKHSLTPDKLINIKYKNRLTKALILLLEKYFQTHLLKYKYLFFKNFKYFLKHKKKKLYRNKTYMKNKDISTSLSNYYQTEINNNMDKNKFLNKFASRKERILMYLLKNENTSNSPDKINTSELCRSRSELNKKKEIIDRRKRSQSKNQEKSTEKEKERNEKRNIKNNKINRNKNTHKGNINIIKNEPYDYSGKIVIIKKINTSDKKFNIDIKSYDYMYFPKKTKFINLKIIKGESVDLVNKKNISDTNFFLQQLRYKYYNNRKFEKYNDKNSLGLIKEEEEKS